MNDLQKRTWAEIHLDRLEHNYKALRALAPDSKFIGLVKANAYGHGAVAVAKKLAELGADYLAVACIDEALELRRAYVTVPVLILGNTDPAYTRQLLEYDLTQTIYDRELAALFSAQAKKLGAALRCHMKVDTGMGRLGVLWNGEESSADTLEEMYRLPNLKWEGVFMHFSDADTSPDYSRIQIDRFKSLLEELERRQVNIPLRHCCAGAATILYPEAHFDMIRPGIPLFGLYPDPCTRDKIDLQPVMELKTHLISVKELPAGSCISYGRTYTLERDSKVAVVPVGYADGLPRCLSGKMEMLVGGRKARQIGRICMDMCMLDVTDIPDVAPGDEVTIFGDGVPLQALADAADTITYELMCAVAPRVPRIYLD